MNHEKNGLALWPSYPNFVITAKADPKYPELFEIMKEEQAPLEACKHCGTLEDFIELTPYLIAYNYNASDISRQVPLSKAEQEFEYFQKQLTQKHGKNFRQCGIKTKVLLKPSHKSDCKRDPDDDYGDFISTDNPLYASKFVRFIMRGKFFYTYLKLDPETVNQFPEMDTACVKKLVEKLRDIYFKEGSIEEIRCPANDSVVKSTNYGVPPGFSNDQLDGLNWMREIEDDNPNKSNLIFHNYSIEDWRSGGLKVRIDETSYYVEIMPSIDAKEITSLPEAPINPVQLKGGVLDCIPGKESKAVVLALIHSNPFESIKTEIDKKIKISRATLIICHINEIFEWKAEAEKCNPNFKIEVVTEDEVKSKKLDFDSDIILIDRYAYFPQVLFHRVVMTKYYEEIERNVQVLKPVLLTELIPIINGLLDMISRH